MVDFCHNKRLDMLNFGCILPKLANTCLHKSVTAKSQLFTESGRDLLEEIRVDMVGGPSILFTWNVVVDKTFVRNSTNWCKAMGGIDASQLCLFSTCQAMPTGLHTLLELD